MLARVHARVLLMKYCSILALTALLSAWPERHAGATTAVDPATVTVLHVFTAADGTLPKGDLTLAADGNFYGTAERGGAHGWGTVYRITPAGVVTVLHSFNGADGSHPSFGVTEGSDGNFYGVAANDGPHRQGVVFRVTPTGQFAILHAFDYDDPRAGARATGRLVLAGDGSLFGVTLVASNPAIGALYRIGTDGTFTLIPVPEGKGRVCCGESIVLGHDGNFYGVSRDGGAAGRGAIFKLTPDGALTILHEFHGPDGTQPRVALFAGADGAFYGSAARGEPDAPCDSCGSLFKITAAGEFTLLHRFSGNDGRRPMSGLVPAPHGNFFGGTIGRETYGEAALFRMTPQGNLSALATLDSGVDDRDELTMVLGTDGNYYGTVSEGGATRLGTFFRLTPRASSRTVLTAGAGTHATLKGNVLTYRETASGKPVSIKVLRPLYVTASMQKNIAGAIGPWIWLSPEGKDGAMISVAQDDTVQVQLVDGDAARRMLPPGASP